MKKVCPVGQDLRGHHMTKTVTVLAQLLSYHLFALLNCMCVYMHMCARLCIYMCTRDCICMCAYMYACVNMHACM